MGLFDSMFGGSTSPNKELSSHEALLGILLAANASDGHISQEEVQGFVTSVVRMSMFQEWRPEKINKAIDKMLNMIRKKGATETMRTCADTLPEKLHRCVFANAVDLVMADGVVEDEEKEYINDLRAALGLSGDDAQMIAQVIVWKNQG
jgi:tellurite resistance protein